MPDSRLTLALNCGSSSLKFGVFSGEQLLLEGEAEEIGSSDSTFWSRVEGKDKQQKRQSVSDHAAALEVARLTWQEAGLEHISAVGHRVVHGGPRLRDHFRLNAESVRELRQAVPFAPLHLPSSLTVIETVSRLLPNLPQVICLDTAFHKDLPDVAKTFAFSKQVREQGVQRYGFHGLSVESIVEQVKQMPRRTVVAHLGNGSSVTALENGKSVDTTMGLTPTGGVMMGTRCGDVDPGALLFLLHQGSTADDLAKLVDHQSGLLGVSERTSDVRELNRERETDSRCDLALRMFAYQVKKAIAAMAAALGGLDLLVFTGGIGEHDEALRQEITGGLSFLAGMNVKTLPAQEDLQIARITARLLGL